MTISWKDIEKPYLWLQLLFATQVFEVLRVLSKSGTVWLHSHNRENVSGRLFSRSFLIARWLKNLPSKQEMQVQSFSQEDSLEEEIFHSSPGKSSGQRRWWATVQVVTKSRTKLRRLSLHTHRPPYVENRVSSRRDSELRLLWYNLQSFDHIVLRRWSLIV